MSDSAAALEAVTAAAKASFGGRLRAVYVIGSLAHGGFSPRVSDIDIALVLTDTREGSDTERASETELDARRRLDSPLLGHLSLFWGAVSPAGTFVGGRFPAADRAFLLQSGRLLFGSEIRPLLEQPSHRELVVEAASLALKMLSVPAIVPEGTIDATALILSPERLVEAGERSLTKIALFPARFLFTAREGRVAPVAEAVAWFLAAEREGPSARLVRRALGWRTTPINDRAEARELCAAGMKPLYLRFINDYVPRVRAHGEPALAESLLEWRAALA